MSGARVLLTGAFGNVGANTLDELLEAGHEVHAFDISTPATRKQAARKEGVFSTHWGDLRNPEHVQRVFDAARPEVVLHVAAVIAPLAYVKPELAREVNVDGTRLLVEAAQRMENPPRFVFTSSYSVHGPRNPYRDLPPLTGDTPVNPSDNYGQHKVDGENMLAASDLDWCVLRLPAVMATNPGWGRDPAFLKFFFTLSPDRREHVLDSRDAGLALCNAVEAEGIVGRAFDLGGPEEDCRVRGIDFHRAGMEAQGLSAVPESTFRHSDPNVDESWYFEDWIDTSESQALLKYQRYGLADHMAMQREMAGNRVYLNRAIAPLVRAYIRRQSPYAGRRSAPDPTPQAEVIAKTFGM